MEGEVKLGNMMGKASLHRQCLWLKTPFCFHKVELILRYLNPIMHGACVTGRMKGYFRGAFGIEFQTLKPTKVSVRHSDSFCQIHK